jgi:hypothetical protein
MNEHIDQRIPVDALAQAFQMCSYEFIDDITSNVLGLVVGAMCQELPLSQDW